MRLCGRILYIHPYLIWKEDPIEHILLYDHYPLALLAHSCALRGFWNNQKHPILADPWTIRLGVMDLSPGNKFVGRLRPVAGGHGQHFYYEKVKTSNIIQINLQNFMASHHDGFSNTVVRSCYL